MATFTYICTYTRRTNDMLINYHSSHTQWSDNSRIIAQFSSPTKQRDPATVFFETWDAAKKNAGFYQARGVKPKTNKRKKKKVRGASRLLSFALPPSFSPFLLPFPSPPSPFPPILNSTSASPLCALADRSTVHHITQKKAAPKTSDDMIVDQKEHFMLPFVRNGNTIKHIT